MTCRSPSSSSTAKLIDEGLVIIDDVEVLTYVGRSAGRKSTGRK
ncbi:MAG: hypothetical protein ACR2KK_20295 [Acidimicrobiales bacterium]